MSGLIWAGLGKGIAAAGETVGNAMMKQQMMEDAKKAELEKEERADKRLNEREDAKTAKEEAKTEARAKLVRDSYKDAEDMPMKRDAAGLLSYGKRNFGAEGEMSEADMDTVRNMPDAARKIYEEEGAVDKQSDPRLQRAQDAAEVAAGKGADSKTLEYFEDAKKKILDAIKEENRVVIEDKKEAGRIERERLQRQSDREDAESRERIASGRNQTLLAAVSARESGKADKPEKLGEIEKMELQDLRTAIRDKKKALNDTPRPSEKAKLQKEVDDLEAEYGRLKADYNPKPKQESPKPSTSKPAGGQSSAPVKVGDKSAYDALPSGTRYIAPDGSIRTKK